MLGGLFDSGKKFAQGIAGINNHIASVRGLNFKPRVIFCYKSHADGSSIPYSIYNPNYSTTRSITVSSASAPSHYDCTIYDDGFDINCNSYSFPNGAYWTAYE